MQEIIKMIEKLSGRYSSNIIFDDFVRMFAIAISNATDIVHNDLWSKREQIYKEIVKKYNNEELDIFPKIFAKLVDLFEGKIDDWLGKIYMSCNMGNSSTGQFFTPFNLSELCSNLNINEEILNRDKIELYEPSCGGGGMILAYAKVLQDKGINYQKKLKVVAQDLDYRAVYMTYIQLSLCGINAIVQQGDTLSEPIVKDSDRIFYTPSYKGLF